jgi:hypothetical protein
MKLALNAYPSISFEGHTVLAVVDSRAALRDRIFAVAEQIRNHPDNIASAIQSLLVRAENCLANGGGHFEQLL